MWLVAALMGGSTESFLSGLNHAPVSVLSVVVVLILLIWIKSRLSRRRSVTYLSRRRSVTYMGSDEFGYGYGENPATVHTMGLNRESLDTLPIFEYKSQNCKQGLECAVCLSEFQENEKCRVLSNCNHIFHTECIDMWFYSHSTCPLCRTAVQPYSSSKVFSNNIGGMNGSVYTHLMRGQTSSRAVHYQNPPDIVLWVRENEMDQGISTGIS